MNVLSLMNKSFLNNSELLNDKMQNLNGVASKIESREGNSGFSFGDIINKEIDKVNEAQIKADKLTTGFMTGEVDDLHSVMIATEEARLSLELAVQIRNKVIEAFKEVNNMQL